MTPILSHKKHPYPSSPSSPFNDWCASQATQQHHPFLSQTFDPWRATVPVLRRCLATLGLSIPRTARKPALVHAFELHSPLLIPLFEAQLRLRFAPRGSKRLRRSRLCAEHPPKLAALGLGPGLRQLQQQTDSEQQNEEKIEEQKEEKEKRQDTGQDAEGLDQRRRRLAQLDRHGLDDLVQLRHDMRRAEARLGSTMAEVERLRCKAQGLLVELDLGLAGLEDARFKCIEWRESLTDDLRLWLSMQS